MEFVADFHIHSKYSRATSRDMDVKHIADWAKLKGIALMGTGDFTHHLWLQELKANLEDLGNGLFKHKNIHFILTAEVSSIYSKKGKVYRIHNLIFAPSFKTVEKINATLGRQGNLASDGRPILGLDAEELARIVFDIDENCMVIPAHAWTPWFSLFGSMSGFNKIEDCFGKQTSKIFALETGLSSDPAMNWRLSALDKFSLISNSDSHSPSRIGREANVFNCELNYSEIKKVLEKKDKNKFLYTIEFFPEEGKYHFDGHRNCNLRLSPQETKKYKGICPRCSKPVTRGVLNRVDELADRAEGFRPEGAIDYKSMVSLDEIIADVKGVDKKSKAVEKEYLNVLSSFSSEFDILIKVPEAELFSKLPEKIAEGIKRVREGRLKIEPGYDGEYGKIKIFGGEEEKKNEQLTLF
ncbi:MAG: endonuclease Q family protein [Candidatus Omnitrophica bacterium]|jgi:PHP family Zn ribbon phosphoesterase|nr:endonuclease Q family protein [Candidatus Omnitrophota bacterium]